MIRQSGWVPHRRVYEACFLSSRCFAVSGGNCPRFWNSQSMNVPHHLLLRNSQCNEHNSDWILTDPDMNVGHLFSDGDSVWPAFCCVLGHFLWWTQGWEAEESWAACCTQVFGLFRETPLWLPWGSASSVHHPSLHIHCCSILGGIFWCVHKLLACYFGSYWHCWHVALLHWKFGKFPRWILLCIGETTGR